MSQPKPLTVITPGLLVPGEDLVQLGAWLQLLRELLAGRVAPGEVRQPRSLPLLHHYIAEIGQAAAECDAARYLAVTAARAAPTPQVVAAAQTKRSSEAQEMITTAEAGALLGVSSERARQLAAAGHIRAHKGPRETWFLARAGVIAYRDRRESRTHHDRTTDDGLASTPERSPRRGGAAA